MIQTHVSFMIRPWSSRATRGNEVKKNIWASKRAEKIDQDRRMDKGKGREEWKTSENANKVAGEKEENKEKV